MNDILDRRSVSFSMCLRQNTKYKIDYGFIKRFLTLFSYKDKNKIAFAVQTIIFFHCLNSSSH